MQMLIICTNKLYKDFKSDYTFKKFYIIQTPPGCNSKKGHQTIREAQRQFAEENENINILTRHGFLLNPQTKDGNYFMPDGCHYHAYGYNVLAHWISNLAKYDFYGSTVDYQAPKLIDVRFESSTSLVIEFDKAIMIQPDLLVDGMLYSAKNYLFAINNKRITSISKLEVDFENPKKLHLTFLGHNISKGDSFTYILGDNYPSTSTPFRGPWIIDAITGVGAVGFTSIIK